jgi:hypothetical protein
MKGREGFAYNVWQAVITLLPAGSSLSSEKKKKTR